MEEDNNGVVVLYKNDIQGNRIEEVKAGNSDKGTNFLYDHNGQLIKVTSPYDVVLVENTYDLYGNPLEYRSIQLGLRGKAIQKYVDEWIVNIIDITAYVKEMLDKRDRGIDISSLLPKEQVYTI